jgi:hypothetical protein
MPREATATLQGRHLVSEQRRSEKDEKGRGQEEKWQRDPLNAVVWAAILVWAGIIVLVGNLELSGLVTAENGWAIGFVGAGVIVLLGVVARMLLPEYRRPVGGSLIFGCVLLGVGLGELVSWVIIGPLVLFAIAASIIMQGFGRRS